MTLRRHRPQQPGSDYRRVWRIVDGAVRDTLLQHPEYLTDAGKRNLRTSINKRVTGALQGHATQVARGRSGAWSDVPAADVGPACMQPVAPGKGSLWTWIGNHAASLWAGGTPPSAHSRERGA